MSASNRENESCPTTNVATLIGDKWVLLILRDLISGTMRFGELEKSLKINPRTLSNRLANLEQDEIVKRQCFAEVPPRVEYSLTEKGKALIPIVDEMCAFAKVWLKD